MAADPAEQELDEMLAAGLSLDEINAQLDVALAQNKVKPPMAGPQPGPWESGYRTPLDIAEEAKRRPMSAPSRPDPSPAKPPTTGQKIAAALDPASMFGDLKNTAGAIGSGFNRMISGGAIPALMDKMGVSSPEERAGFEQKSPAGRVAGEMLGMAPLMGMGGGIVTGLAQRGAAAAPGLVRRVATAAADAAVPEAVTSTLEGADAGETLKRAGVAGAAGAALPVAGETARGVGKVADWLDPWVARFRKAKSEGAYKQPEMSSLEKGAEGIQQAAQKGRDRIMTRDAELVDEAGEAYGKAVDPVLGKDGDPLAVRESLMELATKHSTSSGAPLRGGKVQERIKAVLGEIGLEPTVDDLLKVRRSLRKAGAPDSLNPTDDQIINREIYAAVKDSLPETAAADKAFAQAKDRSDRTTDIIARKEGNVTDASGEGRVGTEQSMAAAVKRVGDDNEPGLRMREHLEELASQDPEFAAALEFVANKKAQEATRFGLSTPIPSKFSDAMKLAGAGPLLEQNWRALASSAATVGDAAGGAAVKASKATRPATPWVMDELDEALEFRRKRKKEKKR